MRLFLGIPVSEEIREKSRELQEELKKFTGGFKLVKPENLHLTIKFFGEVDAKEIKVVLREIKWGKKFKVKIGGVGVFPNKNYVRVIWLGLKGEELFKLQKKVEEKFPAERDFSIHLTLSRVSFVKNKENLQNFLEKYAVSYFGEMVVEKVILYESQLNPEGPEYKVVEEYRLA